jgi:exosortase
LADTHGSAAGELPTGTTWVELVAVGAALSALYAPVVAGLWSDWLTDDNYAHGILVPPFIGWLLWQQRDTWQKTPARPATSGLVVVAFGLLVYLVGHAAFEWFLTRQSLLIVIAGAIVYLRGWRHLRLSLFPLLLAALAIPLPVLLFNEIAVPMQLVASQLGVAMLDASGIPAVREGNIIYLQQATLEVAEACSGVRSLISLGTVALVYGYLARQSIAVRVAVVLSVLPVVIVANGFRVAGAGVAAHLYGAETAAGFLHTFSGWLFFGMAVLMLVGVERLSTFGWPGTRGEHGAEHA